MQASGPPEGRSESFLSFLDCEVGEDSVPNTYKRIVYCEEMGT